MCNIDLSDGTYKCDICSTTVGLGWFGSTSGIVCGSRECQEQIGIRYKEQCEAMEAEWELNRELEENY